MLGEGIATDHRMRIESPSISSEIFDISFVQPMGWTTFMRGAANMVQRSDATRRRSLVWGMFDLDLPRHDRAGRVLKIARASGVRAARTQDERARRRSIDR
jgi:hypothetical protein